MSGARVAVIGLVVVGACQRLHPLELVPVASGGADITARVTSTAAANGFREYSIELANSTSAPAELDLAAAQLEYVSLLDESTLTALTVSGGTGEPPIEPPPRAAPPRVVVGPGEMRVVWLGFAIPDDGRLRSIRREQLTLPRVGTVVINDTTPEHPAGLRTYPVGVERCRSCSAHRSRLPRTNRWRTHPMTWARRCSDASYDWRHMSGCSNGSRQRP